MLLAFTAAAEATVAIGTICTFRSRYIYSLIEQKTYLFFVKWKEFGSICYAISRKFLIIHKKKFIFGYYNFFMWNNIHFFFDQTKLLLLCTADTVLSKVDNFVVLETQRSTFHIQNFCQPIFFSPSFFAIEHSEMKKNNRATFEKFKYIKYMHNIIFNFAKLPDGVSPFARL